MTLAAALIAVAALVAQPSEPVQNCRLIEPTAAQRDADFVNAVAHGPFAMVTLSGQSSCRFSQPGEGACRLSDPRLVHITMNGDDFWYEIAEGASARVDVSDGAAVCRVVSAR